MSRQIRKMNLKDLIAKNKREIEKDAKLLEKIERKLDLKHVQFLEK